MENIFYVKNIFHIENVFYLKKPLVVTPAEGHALVKGFGLWV
jgi:hypothetical protein